MAEIRTFVETREYHRFIEFCQACCRYRYIGLCYGPPGVGKTLSAQRYTNWQRIKALDPLSQAPLKAVLEGGEAHTVLYTAPAVNSPGQVERDIQALRNRLLSVAREPLRREEEAAMEQARQQEAKKRQEWEEQLLRMDWLAQMRVEPLHRPPPPYGQIAREFEKRLHQIHDPTKLLIIDEADRLRMATLEVARAIFDRGDIAMVLVGMPGMEKRLARYPQFYSRIGFVHEFRALGAADVRQLLLEGWTPPEVDLPLLEEEALTAIIRMTGGNFRLLDRLLSQIERIVQINELASVTREAVEAARESLVIGQQ